MPMRFADEESNTFTDLTRVFLEGPPYRISEWQTQMSSSKKNRPKRHHFVPRWYLEGFSDSSGFVHVFDRRKKIWRRQKPDQVMVITNYYRQEWAPTGIDPNILEKTLGTGPEAQGQQAFKKLIEQNDISQVTHDDAAAMLAYLELQRIRVPRQASQAAELLRTVLLERMPREDAELVLSGRITIKSTDAFRFHTMRIQWGTLLPWLARMQWLVIEAPPDTAFLTSDSPVSFYHGNFPPPAEAGLGLAGTMVLFPLCSRKLLLLRHPEITGQAGTISGYTMATAPDVNSDQTLLTYGGICPAEQVQILNSTILALSDQLVVGESKEALEACVGESLRGH